MRFGTAAATTAVPALWTLRHLRSQAVRSWAPSILPGRRIGRLYARASGDGDLATVLLHGMVSTGEVFGSTYDVLAGESRLIVPDLLGFGRSLDATRSTFPVEEHLDALDELADRAGLFQTRWRIGAHSMGSGLALRWAARHPDHVSRVVCWGAPLYESGAAAQRGISGSLMARLFALDTRWAARACAISCRHRSAAGWLTAALEPSLPVPVARAVSLHTWPAYRDAMRDLVIETPWPQLLTALDGNRTRVNLVWASGDQVGRHEHARTLAENLHHTTVTLMTGAEHRLPMTHPQVCIDQLRGRHDQ